MTDIKIVPTDGGEIRDLLNFKPHGSISYCTWTPDGKHILYTMPELCQVPISGGQSQTLDLKMAGAFHFSLHPDGQRIAFNSYGTSKKEPEIWVMENFLPLVQNKK